MNNRTLKLAQLGILTAIVAALQILAIVTRPLFPMFSISLVLIPITVGAALIGVRAGGWLGLAFGAAVLISGDAAAFLAVSVPATVFLVLLKGTLAGLAAGFVYKIAAEKLKNKTAAALLAGITCPIANTGTFILGSYAFFLPTVRAWGEASGYAGAAAYIFLGMVGVNFLVELGINLVLIPVIVRLIQYGQSKRAV